MHEFKIFNVNFFPKIRLLNAKNYLIFINTQSCIGVTLCVGSEHNFTNLLLKFTVSDQNYGLLQNLEVVFDYVFINFRTFYKT